MIRRPMGSIIRLGWVQVGH